MKLNRDLLMKVGIVVAIAIIIYLLYRSRNCKDNYANYVPSVPEEDYAEEEAYEDESADYAEEDMDDEGQENYTLMESTLDDESANAVFDPSM